MTVNSREYESLNGLAGSNSQYESLNGLGDDPSSYLNFSTDGGYIMGYGSNYDPSSVALTAAPLAQSIAPSSSGFNWNALFGNLINAGAQTGLSIARSVTNPAYTTPGAYTRLPDGTVIATPIPQNSSGYLNTVGMFGNFSGSSILLLGGAALVVLMLVAKK